MSMGSVRTHQGIHVIEGCGNSSYIIVLWKKMKKIIERLRKLVKL